MTGTLPDVVSLSTPSLLNMIEFSDSLLRDRFVGFLEKPHLSVAQVDDFCPLLLLIGQSWTQNSASKTSRTLSITSRAKADIASQKPPPKLPRAATAGPSERRSGDSKTRSESEWRDADSTSSFHSSIHNRESF